MLKCKRVLLIDDFITTGSTLAECTKILIKCGCSDICCAAVCSAD
jgi:predicted amidophosphoribosyltransferase